MRGSSQAQEPTTEPTSRPSTTPRVAEGAWLKLSDGASNLWDRKDPKKPLENGGGALQSRPKTPRSRGTLPKPLRRFHNKPLPRGGEPEGHLKVIRRQRKTPNKQLSQGFCGGYTLTPE